ncbi:MAG: hypothetical protein HY248_01910 [Fimbriimonas ginsengisoli]|uniref:LTD domain-containing protein n=1 Tax=Fimbriimonas ginsengisoli TaxID=1005039 RepID=A0A931LTK7_FIMGI|nr:hypothetical protein [Fimbriimonas ginsengisoli]MBI3721282.1 hypothetical protein [Fimbriimonas ginsengisoli]
MIRIVGVQRSSELEQEFVLLQNQGSLRMNLRGHLILSDDSLERDDYHVRAHLFRDDVMIPPGNYVLLHTGNGEPKWMRTKDLQLVYYAYMGRIRPVWEQCTGPFHVLGPQHTYSERRETLLLR